jgi:hypothetical protein
LAYLHKELKKEANNDGFSISGLTVGLSALMGWI